MGRLRHEIGPWLWRERGRGVSTVIGAVLARVRFRSALQSEPLDRALDRSVAHPCAAVAWSDAVVTARIADALGGWLTGGTCLERAVGRAHALRRLGWPARIVVGARLNDASAPCHAWVEVAGEPFLDTTTVDYLAITAHPS